MPRIRRAQKMIRRIKPKIRRNVNAKLRSPRPKNRLKRRY